MSTQFIVENVVLFVMMWALIFFRYILVAGGFHLYYYKIKNEAFKANRISTKLRKTHQTKKEIIASIHSSGLFAIGGVFLIRIWSSGYALIYNDLYKFGILYLILSALLFFIFT